MPFPAGVPTRLRVRLLPLLLLVAGCDFDIAGDRPMEPPAVYREWWAKTEACSGLSGDFDRVEWLVVPGRSFDCKSGQCVGHWHPGHQIYIAEEWLRIGNREKFGMWSAIKNVRCDAAGRDPFGASDGGAGDRGLPGGLEID